MLDQFVHSLPTLNPNPWLSPIDVVKIHLDALQNNDLMPGNEGIVAAYNFASPVNKRMIGSLEHYRRLLRSPLYSSLIGFERANVQVLGRKRQTTEVQVMLTRGQDVTGFYYTLSRQMEAPFVGCWMIDGIVPNF